MPLIDWYSNKDEYAFDYHGGYEGDNTSDLDNYQKLCRYLFDQGYIAPIQMGNKYFCKKKEEVLLVNLIFTEGKYDYDKREVTNLSLLKEKAKGRKIEELPAKKEASDKTYSQEAEEYLEYVKQLEEYERSYANSVGEEKEHDKPPKSSLEWQMWQSVPEDKIVAPLDENESGKFNAIKSALGGLSGQVQKIRKNDVKDKPSSEYYTFFYNKDGIDKDENIYALLVTNESTSHRIDELWKEIGKKAIVETSAHPNPSPPKFSDKISSLFFKGSKREPDKTLDEKECQGQALKDHVTRTLDTRTIKTKGMHRDINILEFLDNVSKHQAIVDPKSAFEELFFVWLYIQETGNPISPISTRVKQIQKELEPSKLSASELGTYLSQRCDVVGFALGQRFTGKVDSAFSNFLERFRPKEVEEGRDRSMTPRDV